MNSAVVSRCIRSRNYKKKLLREMFTDEAIGLKGEPLSETFGRPYKILGREPTVGITSTWNRPRSVLEAVARRNDFFGILRRNPDVMIIPFPCLQHIIRKADDSLIITSFPVGFHARNSVCIWGLVQRLFKFFSATC